MPKKTTDTESTESKTTEPKTKEKKPTSSKQDAVRRDFLKVSVAGGVGICAIGAPICAGVRLVTAPLFAESASGKFYPLATLASLTEKPQKFTIVDDKKDAWTTLSDQKIGSVFLRKIGNEVQAFQALCPHMGCVIQTGCKTNPQTGAEEEIFYCPCHSACYDLDGKRLDSVAPRNMDSLEVKVEEGRVSVKFEKFTFGIADKKAT